MDVTSVKHLESLRPLIGHWRSSGTILSIDDGSEVGSIAGTDTYQWVPGGHWVMHDVDVMMGEERKQVVELIGGHDGESGGWQMHSFDTADTPGRMSLTVHEPGLLLLQGDGIRSWLRPDAGGGRMTAHWERELNGVWIPWMDMRFDRE